MLQLRIGQKVRVVIEIAFGKTDELKRRVRP